MPILVLIAAIGFALSPLLAPGFGGFDSGQFPFPQIEPPVQPAGYAFAIWGLIYLWLIAGAGYGMWRRRNDMDWAAMRLPLLISLAVGVTWLPVAQASAVWATILIWVMWAFAVWAVLRTPTGGRHRRMAGPRARRAIHRMADSSILRIAGPDGGGFRRNEPNSRRNSRTANCARARSADRAAKAGCDGLSRRCDLGVDWRLRAKLAGRHDVRPHPRRDRRRRSCGAGGEKRASGLTRRGGDLICSLTETRGHA